MLVTYLLSGIVGVCVCEMKFQFISKSYFSITDAVMPPVDMSNM